MRLGMKPLPFASAELAAQLPKRLSRLAGDRAQELNLLRDEFGGAENLARFYVEPHVQERCPADRRRGLPAPAPREPAFSVLSRFLEGGQPVCRDGSHQLFLLAEAGMGKTSLLLMVKLLQLAGFWPPGCRCELFRLGPDSLAQIAAVEGKADTVLLLDGLNEDRAARGRTQERLRELVEAAWPFRRALITCRSHFFPEVLANSAGQLLIRGLSGCNCSVLHLAPLDRRQAQALLRRLLPWNGAGCLGLSGFSAVRQRTRAAQLLEQIAELERQPLLLQQIETLLEAADGRSNWTTYTLYETLLRGWLDRKLRTLQAQRPDCVRLPERAEMFNACIRVARWMERQDRQEIAEQDLWELLCEDANTCWLDRFEPDSCSLLHKTPSRAFRFSHPTFREFLLACSLISDCEPPSRPVRATDQLIRFLELAGGLAPHLGRLDFSGFNLLRYADSHGSFFSWRDQIPGKGGRPPLDGPEIIILPGGRFRMGDIGGIGPENARPAHEVELDSFGIGRYPVTFAEFDEFCMATGRARPPDEGWGRARRPVVNVSWQDAGDYCEWLSRQTGRNYRLPTEAEWEYACRAGSGAAYCFGDDPGQLDRYAWHSANAGQKTQPVGGKHPNAWGLHDMHGNVWEWCADWYAKDGYPAWPVRNPAGAEQGAGRVLRGGSWDSSAKFASSCFRFCLSPGLRIIRAGFRVALGA
ncbi:SUMF1/EgtB/PvdO family nonheme iron enzyme [Candidatus Electronema sp. JC]|uniref:SUMF1/EgtB/PvdO family nonheme iron enzyme n=1 Tax=Candidatus Electronema sp. JC TaxID=3401570 RepID=UPI003AA96C2D